MEQDAWLQRVLGVAVSAAAPTRDWAAARDNWRAAGEAVDAQISKLQAALRNSGDDMLEDIAEFGLNGITGGHRVRLAAALQALDPGKPAVFAKLAPPTLKVIRDYLAFLTGDEAIEVCDLNPLGVPVSIRATLGPALEAMAAVLEAELAGAA